MLQFMLTKGEKVTKDEYHRFCDKALESKYLLEYNYLFLFVLFCFKNSIHYLIYSSKSFISTLSASFIILSIRLHALQLHLCSIYAC